MSKQNRHHLIYCAYMFEGYAPRDDLVIRLCSNAHMALHKALDRYAPGSDRNPVKLEAISRLHLNQVAENYSMAVEQGAGLKQKIIVYQSILRAYSGLVSCPGLKAHSEHFDMQLKYLHQNGCFDTLSNLEACGCVTA